MVMGRVEGKVAIVTGAALGIGRSAAEMLAAEGARVAVTNVQDERGRACAQEIKRAGGVARYWSGIVWRVSLTFLLFPLFAGPLRAQRPDVESVSQELKSRVELLRATGAVSIGNEVVSSSELTLDAYEQRGFLPLWTDRGSVASLLRAVADIRRDGLDPEEYHLSALTALARGPLAPSSAAELDLLCTDAFVRLGHDLRFGKVEPQGPAAADEAAWRFGGPDAVANLSEVVASGRVQEALAELRPVHFVYRGLVEALADLRRIQAEGGWETLPPGPTMRRDSIDERVPLLRRRLALEPGASVRRDDVDLRVDAALEAAVEAFQHRHGLNEDGLVGPATQAALNVPVERRIDQVRVNLERARWVAQELPDTFVAVNVAGARVYLLHGETVVFETRAIVGTGYTST
jgi:murein L,D-transpeptidase YcbB/YkuD